ncbi:cation diffusion facilitator family transporter [Aureimonas populi]|uniref:Cation diffusion facilitator family transporter n=1 Tax=Aureimonas populi TaxID=1701758 RepID=A0ABW5CJU4_9HYPH|nr:cation transporter [Aureimonas populi]
MPTERAEQAVLTRSIAATLVVGSIGVGFGILSGAQSIIFDGLFSAVDAAMTFLALLVSRLIARDTSGSRRFQMGFWHIEPMVLAFNAGLLMVLTLYAFINAVTALVEGGRQLAFGWAIAYASIVVAICAVMAWTGRRAAARTGSQFLILDAKGWLISGLITLALLVAFAIGYALQGTAYEGLTPYVDPAVLAVLTLCIVPMPFRILREAIADIFLVAPRELDEAARRVAAKAVKDHGFSAAHTYVAKVGRSRMIEIHFILPPGYEVGPVERLDAVREEVGAALGGEARDRWLTVVFTGQERWAV